MQGGKWYELEELQRYTITRVLIECGNVFRILHPTNAEQVLTAQRKLGQIILQSQLLTCETVRSSDSNNCSGCCCHHCGSCDGVCEVISVLSSQCPFVLCPQSREDKVPHSLSSSKAAIDFWGCAMQEWTTTKEKRSPFRSSLIRWVLSKRVKLNSSNEKVTEVREQRGDCRSCLNEMFYLV